MKRPTKEEVEREDLALDPLDTKTLRARWQALYRKDPPPTFRARLLRLGIGYRLQERAFGGLKPQTVRLLQKLAAQLRSERAAGLGGESDAGPPAHRRATREAHVLPGQIFAGGGPGRFGQRPTVSQSFALTPGTQLMREWNGTTEVVDVVAEGFVWRGTTYRTLSAVAGAITGTKWSGPKFFGLVPPSKRGSVARSRSDRATPAASIAAIMADGGSR